MCGQKRNNVAAWPPNASCWMYPNKNKKLSTVRQQQDYTNKKDFPLCLAVAVVYISTVKAYLEEKHPPSHPNLPAKKEEQSQFTLSNHGIG